MTKLCKDCVHCKKDSGGQYEGHYWKCTSGHNEEPHPVTGSRPIMIYCEDLRKKTMNMNLCGPEGRWWMPSANRVKTIYDAAIDAAKG